MRCGGAAARPGLFFRGAATAGIYSPALRDGPPGFSGDGGPATMAGLTLPAGVAVDGSGNLVIADSPDNRVRVVAARTGRVCGGAVAARALYSLAGAGTGGFAGGGRPPAQAGVGLPPGRALD